MDLELEMTILKDALDASLLVSKESLKLYGTAYVGIPFMSANTVVNTLIYDNFLERYTHIEYPLETVDGIKFKRIDL